MSYEIKWMGNEYTNSSSREGNIPFVIVDHISAGTMNSMDSWFTSSGNTISSAHFGVSKKGEIHQYVEIERFAWANGTSLNYMPKYPAQVWIDKKYTNANYWSVSIEHEGTDGDLTEEQFQASVWLHRYIRDYITSKWGQEYAFPLDNYHVIGHFQLHSWKEYCPGIMFPWVRLYETLKNEEHNKEENEMKFEHDWQWKMLGDALDGMYRKGLIADYTWAEKAYTRVLTQSELTWLNAIIYARQNGIEV